MLTPLAFVVLLSINGQLSAEGFQYQQNKLSEAVSRVAAAAARGQNPIVIFDIDLTLADNRPICLWVLKEFLANDQARKRYPGNFEASVQKLKEMDLQPEHIRSFDWTVTFKALGIDDLPLSAAMNDYKTNRAIFPDKPANQTRTGIPFDPALFDASLHLKHPQVPGAADFVRAVYEAGARVVYLTDRNEGLRDVTTRWLKNNDFPINRGRTRLILKPIDDTAPSDAYKAKVVKELQGSGRVEACFDDSPKNLSSLKTAAPETMMFFLDTHQESKEALPPGTYIIRDFVVPLEAPGLKKLELASPDLDKMLPQAPTFDSGPSR